MKNEVKNCMFPDEQEFMDFLQLGLKLKTSTIERYISRYRVIKRNYISPQEFLGECSISNSETDRIRLFLCFNIKDYKYDIIKKMKIINTASIINYFHLVDDKFWEIYELQSKKHNTMRERFCNILFKSFIFLGKRNIADFTHEDLLKLDDNKFTTDVGRRRQFVFFFRDLLTMYFKKGSKIDFTAALRKDKGNYRKYGTDNIEFVNYIEQYIKEDFILKGWSDNKPRKNIKLFFDWLRETNKGVEKLADINMSLIEEYKKYINRSNLQQYTKNSRINYMHRFFEWLILTEKTNETIVKIGQREKIEKSNYSEEPRMFDDRKHYMMIVQKLMNYEPKDESEELCKYFCLVISATGLRLGECRWLNEVSVLENKGEIGIVSLHTVDKTSIINKKTSIYYWGLEAIEWLKERFNHRPKILIYNKGLKGYVYTLFEYDGKIISKSILRSFLERIFDTIKFYDSNGNEINYDGKKFHAFRHQKFNDIFEITGGSTKAAQLDSGHKTIKNLLRYVKQKRKEKIAEVSRYISEGKIVGKGAELLKKLLETNMLPEDYLEISKKINISAFYTLDYLKEHIKFLGFGFCKSNKCRYSKMCEGCEHFFTNEKFINELKKRYSVNYVLTMYKVKDLTSIDKFQSNQLISLRYQEKWLSELGVTEEEIIELRRNIFNEG